MFPFGDRGNQTNEGNNAVSNGSDGVMDVRDLLCQTMALLADDHDQTHNHAAQLIRARYLLVQATGLLDQTIRGHIALVACPRIRIKVHAPMISGELA